MSLKYGFNLLRNEGWHGKCQGVGLRRGNRVFYLYKIQLKLMLTIHFYYKSIENYLPLSNSLIRAGSLFRKHTNIFDHICNRSKFVIVVQFASLDRRTISSKISIGNFGQSHARTFFSPSLCYYFKYMLICQFCFLKPRLLPGKRLSEQLYRISLGRGQMKWIISLKLWISPMAILII